MALKNIIKRPERVTCIADSTIDQSHANANYAASGTSANGDEYMTASLASSNILGEICGLTENVDDPTSFGTKRNFCAVQIKGLMKLLSDTAYTSAVFGQGVAAGGGVTIIDDGNVATTGSLVHVTFSGTGRITVTVSTAGAGVLQFVDFIGGMLTTEDLTFGATDTMMTTTNAFSTNVQIRVTTAFSSGTTADFVVGGSTAASGISSPSTTGRGFIVGGETVGADNFLFVII